MEEESVCIVEVLRIELGGRRNDDFIEITFPQVLEIGEVDGHTSMDIDDDRDGLLTGESICKVWIRISRGLCWDLDELWWVRRDRDGVGIPDAVDEFTFGT